MKSTAALTCSSVKAGLPPLAGIKFLPFNELVYSASIPVAIRGAHAALSPSLGEPDTPTAWQEKHNVL